VPYWGSFFVPFFFFFFFFFFFSSVPREWGVLEGAFVGQVLVVRFNGGGQWISRYKKKNAKTLVRAPTFYLRAPWFCNSGRWSCYIFCILVLKACRCARLRAASETNASRTAAESVVVRYIGCSLVFRERHHGVPHAESS